jgi:hypothetical protein
MINFNEENKELTRIIHYFSVHSENGLLNLTNIIQMKLSRSEDEIGI